MSTENHPNFHAIKFATDIVESYCESLRGDGQKLNPIPFPKCLIESFVVNIENFVDLYVEASKE